MKAYLRQGTQSSAVWPPAAGAPRAATRQPRRRASPRIFVVRCGLPSDPPVGGHSCNGGMIPRFEPLVVSGGKAQNEHRFFRFAPESGTYLSILELVPPPAFRECRHRSLAPHPN